MPSLSVQELTKIPYLDVSAVRGRTLSTTSFYDEGEWHLWLPVGDTLVKVKGWPGEGFYFGRDAESPSDIRFNFLEFIAQRACWPAVVPAVSGLRNDFLNLSASLKKFEILFDASKTYNTGTSRLVSTEIEYMFSLCRSVFDLLQEVISAQWDAVQLSDPSFKKKNLPRSFSKMIFEDEQIRNDESIASRFKVPIELARFYLRAAPFFQLLRSFRDRFVHGGTTMGLIFVTERGFAVQSSTKPFSEFGVWNSDHKLPNDLCSLRPALAYVVNETLRCCEDYSQTIQQLVRCPPPLVPGFGFYMRGHFTELLHMNSRILHECLWWDET